MERTGCYDAGDERKDVSYIYADIYDINIYMIYKLIRIYKLCWS